MRWFLRILSIVLYVFGLSIVLAEYAKDAPWKRFDSMVGAVGEAIETGMFKNFGIALISVSLVMFIISFFFRKPFVLKNRKNTNVAKKRSSKLK